MRENPTKEIPKKEELITPQTETQPTPTPENQEQKILHEKLDKLFDRFVQLNQDYPTPLPSKQKDYPDKTSIFFQTSVCMISSINQDGNLVRSNFYAPMPKTKNYDTPEKRAEYIRLSVRPLTEEIDERGDQIAGEKLDLAEDLNIKSLKDQIKYMTEQLNLLEIKLQESTFKHNGKFPINRSYYGSLGETVMQEFLDKYGKKVVIVDDGGF
ncbi:hypothetical protein HQ571_02780 [Candidatus Kuenenbacteria bacterium]|nr:hypothetical protein [Candidatus Kuenenbacteria bacterium]